MEEAKSVKDLINKKVSGGVCALVKLAENSRAAPKARRSGCPFSRSAGKVLCPATIIEIKVP